MLPADAWLPDAALVRLEYITAEPDGLTLVRAARREAVPCPTCGRLTNRVHSRYIRTVADLPWSGWPVRLRLQSRRFFCATPDCGTHIFAERLPGVVAHYARRTSRESQLLEFLAYFAGGEVGAWLAQQFQVATSPDTLLRLLHRRKLVVGETPRVLGVDDWAFRRACVYGTILIDLERRRPVDLLPDRRAETLADWLREHPGVEVISRDRSSSYAQGAREGAPDAQQVADRWHLVRDLAAALEALLQGELETLAAVTSATPTAESLQTPETGALTRGVGASAEEVAAPEEAAAARDDPAVPHMPVPAPNASRAATWRQQRQEQVWELERQGHSGRAIAAVLGLSRNTVRRYLQQPVLPARRVPQPRASPLASYGGSPAGALGGG